MMTHWVLGPRSDRTVGDPRGGPNDIISGQPPESLIADVTDTFERQGGYVKQNERPWWKAGGQISLRQNPEASATDELKEAKGSFFSLSCSQIPLEIVKKSHMMRLNCFLSRSKMPSTILSRLFMTIEQYPQD
jgi:hypothetical protein